MNKLQVMLLALAVLLTGISIITEYPLDSKLMAWIWVVWSLIAMLLILLDKKLKWWK